MQAGRFAVWCLLVLTMRPSALIGEEHPVKGDSVIRGRTPSGEIVLKTSSRCAGAIDSLTWNGKEFLDRTDHGRELQSASNFDAGVQFVPEVFNPTEAGSLSDGAGPTSTSHLLKLVARDNVLETRSQMAFWLRPGEKSLGHPARNTTALSNHLLTKRVEIGVLNLPHVIRHEVTFTVPAGEGHTDAQFEALTGYMPAEFSRFERYDCDRGTLEELDDGPGEQSHPVVFSTPDGKHAMGAYSPDQPSPGFEQAGYGRFRFPAEKVVKWNIVFRVRRAAGIAEGDYAYRNYVIVGDREQVRETLGQLIRKLSPQREK